MRTRSGYHAYHMRCWLRLLWYSRLLSLYPLPMSMLTPGGIAHNNIPVSGFMSPWNQTKTSNSPTTCMVTIFLLGPIMIWSLLFMAMKYGLCGGPSWNIWIWYPFLAISVLCFFSKNAITTSFQNIGSFSPLCYSTRMWTDFRVKVSGQK